MDIRREEVWDRSETEPERAYRAFEVFVSLPIGERTLTAAYQRHVGNPDARHSDTWCRWSSQFAWRERAAAYDDHLASLRREAYERVIGEEAAQQAREIEKTRGRMNELMTVAYHRAMEALEDEDWVRDNLRASDVIRIIGGYMDYLKTFDTEPESTDVDDWEEDGAEIVKEVDALPYLEHPDACLPRLSNQGLTLHNLIGREGQRVRTSYPIQPRCNSRSNSRHRGAANLSSF